MHNILFWHQNKPLAYILLFLENGIVASNFCQVRNFEISK